MSVASQAPLADPAVRRVAYVRLRVGLGDLLCTVPALRALRRARPDVHVTLVTWAEMAPVVERMAPWVDDLLPFPGVDGIPERPPDYPAWPAFQAAARSARFDLALQGYGARVAANDVTEALAARRTGGFFVPGDGAYDLRTHLPCPRHLHEVDRHLALVGHLGVPVAGADRSLAFPIRDADRKEAAAVLAASGLGPHRPLAVLHPGATSASRRWPAGRFAEVGDELAARGYAVAVTGVPSEADAVAAVTRAMRCPAAALVGRTGLGGFAAVLERAALVVANDTGTAHLAAAVGAPSVTVFLSGDPLRWAAFDRDRHRSARVQVECNPCEHLTCPIDHRCAERLPAAAVLAEVAALPGVEAGLSARR